MGTHRATIGGLPHEERSVEQEIVAGPLRAVEAVSLKSFCVQRYDVVPEGYMDDGNLGFQPNLVTWHDMVPRT